MLITIVDLTIFVAETNKQNAHQSRANYRLSYSTDFVFHIQCKRMYNITILIFEKKFLILSKTLLPFYNTRGSVCRSQLAKECMRINVGTVVLYANRTVCYHKHEDSLKWNVIISLYFWIYLYLSLYLLLIATTCWLVYGLKLKYCCEGGESAAMCLLDDVPSSDRWHTAIPSQGRPHIVFGVSLLYIRVDIHTIFC